MTKKNSMVSNYLLTIITDLMTSCINRLLCLILAITVGQMPENFAWTSIDYNPDNWVWDQLNKSPEVLLSTDQENVYFYTDPVYQSTGTAGNIIFSKLLYVHFYAFYLFITNKMLFIKKTQHWNLL